MARDPRRPLAWKDTVLVPTGQTVDILLDITNPGRWMAHCHIAEHHESGMMLSFDVDPQPNATLNAPSELKVSVVDGGGHLTWKDNRPTSPAS